MRKSRRRVSLSENGNVQEMLRGRESGLPPLMSQSRLRKTLSSRARRRQATRRNLGWSSAKWGSAPEAKKFGAPAIFYAWAALVFGCWTRPASSTSRHSDLTNAYPKWVEHLGPQRIGRCAAGIVRHGLHIRRQGYKGQKSIPPPVDASSPHGKECLAEVSKAVAMGAAEWLNPDQVQEVLELPASQRFIMPIFCILQNGKLRCCFNAQELNEYAQKIPFKQNSIRDLLGMIQQGDFFCAMDIRKYFWSIPLAEKDRNLCLFRIRTDKGVRWGRMKCCPFGLRDIPKYSTDLLRPILGYMREAPRHTKVAGVIDDYFLADTCWMACLKRYHMLTRLMQELGLELAPEKAQKVLWYRGSERDEDVEDAMRRGLHRSRNRWKAPVQKVSLTGSDQGAWTKCRRWIEGKGSLPSRWVTSYECLPPDSVLTAPTQTGEMLGFRLDTRLMALFIPRRKIMAVRSQAAEFERRAEAGDRIAIVELEQLHGRLVALKPAAPMVNLYTAALRWTITGALRDNAQNHAARIRLPLRVRLDLRELRRRTLWDLSGRDLLPFQQDITIVNDAGPRGMGAMILQSHRTMAALFERRLIEASQNMRELVADIRSTVSVVQTMDLRDVNVLVLTDNSTSEAYGNQRFRVRELAEQSIPFRKELMARRVQVKFQHLPGARMITTGVDQASRISHSPAAWTIGDHAFSRVQSWLQVMGAEFDLPHPHRFATDMLAEPWNTRARQFVGLTPSGVAAQVAVDATTIAWDKRTVGNLLYAFPPPRLLPPVLAQISSSTADLIILVTPAWTSSTWWPVVARAAAGDPVEIPMAEGNIAPPRMLLPASRSLKPVALHVWTFFGGRSSLKGLLQPRSRRSSVRGRINERGQSTMDRGSNT